MKFLKSKKTSSVFIANDPKAESLLKDGDVEEITREEYAATMQRRDDYYPIAAERPRTITISIDPDSFRLLEQRMSDEKMKVEVGVRKLCEEYALGATLVFKTEITKRYKNEYVESKK